MEAKNELGRTGAPEEKKDVPDHLRRLRGSSKFTAVMTFCSILAVILMYLALSDISKGGENLRLEWIIAGLSLVILAVYLISVIITLAIVFSLPGFFRVKEKKINQS